MRHQHEARTAIDSPANPRVRLLRDLHDVAGRREHGAFLIEGARLVGEAVRSGWPLLMTVYDAERAREDRLLATLVQMIPGAVPATARAVKAAAETTTPQGIVAAAALPERPAGVDPAEPMALLLDGLADPGNAGTLLRSALGAGVRTVLAARGSVDLFSPKVVRAGMGAHFRLRLIPDIDIEDAARVVEVERVFVVAEMDGETPYYQYDWLGKSVLVIGSEATGPSAQARSMATATVSIPIEPELESLNAAIAGSVVMFEAKRQRDVAVSNQPSAISRHPTPGS